MRQDGTISDNPRDGGGIPLTGQDGCRTAGSGATGSAHQIRPAQGSWYDHDAKVGGATYGRAIERLGSGTLAAVVLSEIAAALVAILAIGVAGARADGHHPDQGPGRHPSRISATSTPISISLHSVSAV